LTDLNIFLLSSKNAFSSRDGGAEQNGNCNPVRRNLGRTSGGTPIGAPAIGAPAVSSKYRVVDCDSQCCRLEVYHLGTWGTVCDDYFSSAAALVACRSLGLSGSGYQSAFGGQRRGFDDRPIWCVTITSTNVSVSGGLGATGHMRC